MNGGELAKEFRSSAPASEIFDWCHKAQAALRLQQTVNQALAQKHLSAQGYIVRLEAEIEALKKLAHQRFDDGKRLGIIETEDRLRKAQEK